MKESQVEKPSFEWRWCLVGNIVESHVYGQDGDIKTGTKQFRPGAKVYCALWNWGDGWEHSPVIGLPRHGEKLISLVMPSKYITNLRIQKVFNPAVLKEMEENRFHWQTDSDEDRDSIIRFLKSAEDRGIIVRKNEIWHKYADSAGTFTIASPSNR